ncbi:MAG: AlwI family type II restriction endonuclease, partial [Bacteroidales bacterium]|nr:AlwI family type II restriction endonuclease [Bacteroidales bacterium]
LGFVYFTPNSPIQFSQLGKMLAQVFDVTIVDNYINVEIIHPEYEQKAFMQALAKSQRKNPFVRVLNDNIPLILLAQVISLLNQNPDFRTSKGETKGIARHELPLLIFWKDNNANTLYNRIVRLRKEYGYTPSDEVICDICINEIMQGFKVFKQKSIMEEYPDEFIRKMRITGLFSLRGAGRFLDINYNEEDKITYILKQYSEYNHYTDEQEYFNYMSEIDAHLFEVESKTITENQTEIFLQNWVKVYSWETIQKELLNLQKRTASKDDVLKFLVAPVRLEFLTALSIKSKLPNVRVVPNYTCDDTGLPTSTASGGVGDIECFEDSKGILIEVTMSEGRTQTMMEIWPVERHLSEFQDKTNKHSQAIFIAPTIFSDSQRQIDYVKYSTQRIIRPYTIENFIKFLSETETLYFS